MNRFLTALALVLTGLTAGNLCAQSTRKAAEAQRKAARDAERAKIKAEDQAEQMIAYQEAIKALQAGQFVLEANQAVLQNGVTNYVNSDTNFVMVDGSNGTVQTSSNSGFAGPNGIGGVTLNGTVSGISLKTDRHSNVYYSFSIQGAAISAQVFITLSAGTSNASATISPNFTSNTLTFNGSLVPLQQSDIFMGNSF
jgi:ATPase subunit of ABC transporter with duplicated ATPase domains